MNSMRRDGVVDCFRHLRDVKVLVEEASCGFGEANPHEADGEISADSTRHHDAVYLALI